MKKKISKIILGSSTGMVIMGLIILVPILMLLDFFGANVTDGYVENNMQYADMYRQVVRKNLLSGKGYVSLDRILYFYLENDRLTFDQIYDDNLDTELKQVKLISDVCKMNRYKIYYVCKEDEFSESGQINVIQNKPFNSPLEFNKLSVTSYFMEERVVYGKYNVHEAWDFSSPNQTPVYSVCDGKVVSVSFPYSSNIIDTNGGAGNNIKISCTIDDVNYEILYGHLYPNSTTLKVGDTVKGWQQIATVGTTGYSTGPHLHWQVSRDGNTVDGLSLIDFTNVKSVPSFEIKDLNYGI